MLVPGVKVTFSLASFGYGWSHTLFLAQSPPNFPNARTKANALAQKLNFATNHGTNVEYLRIQDASTRRVGLVEPYSENSPNTGLDGATPQVAAYIRLYNAGLTKSKLLFLRGLEKDLSQTNGRYNPASAQVPKINALIAQLIADEWCWVAKDQTNNNPQPVSAVTTNTDGYPQITFAANVFTTFNANNSVKAQLSLSGLKGATDLNGTWVVYATSATTCTFEKRVLYNTWKSPSGFGRSTGGVLVPIASGKIERLAERKTGRPLYLSRGRSRTKRVGG